MSAPFLKTATKGGAAAFTERAKDVFVAALRSYFGSLENANAIREMPTIMKYGLVEDSPKESFVQITTQLPHEKQRIPSIVVMSATAAERKLGIGRQVIDTYHRESDGRPMVREAVGGDLDILIEISATDTNMRSELADLTMNFFTLYAEERQFSFLGDTEVESTSRTPANYQIILRAQARLQGETDAARPGGESFQRIYFNRVAVPVTFIDYVDREARDIDVCFNPTLTPADDQFAPASGIIPEMGAVMLANSDDFELMSGIDVARWHTITTPGVSANWVKTPAIRGNGSVLITSFATGMAALVSARSPGVITGAVKVRFRLTDPNSAVVLFGLAQGQDVSVFPCYYLVVKPGTETRLELYKGPIQVGATPIATGSRLNVHLNLNLAAQLEWKIDAQTRRIRLRGFVASCRTDDFGSLLNRLEVIDGTDAYLTSVGEGVGYIDQPGFTGQVLIDDPTIVREVIPVGTVNPSRVRPR